MEVLMAFVAGWLACEVYVLLRFHIRRKDV